MNSKKLFFLILYMGSLLIGLNSSVWADVYGFFSEHYTYKHYSGHCKSLKPDVPKQEPYLQDDGGYITRWTNASGTSIDFFGNATDCSEGNYSLKIIVRDIDPGVGAKWAEDVFALYPSTDQSAAHWWKYVRDLKSVGCYIKFNVKTTRDLAIEIWTGVSTTSYAAYKVYLGSTTSENYQYKIPNIDNNQWHTVIIDTGVFSVKTSEVSLSSTIYNGFVMDYISLGGQVVTHIDNFVYMSKLPSTLVVSSPSFTTGNITVPCGLKKVLNADAYDSDGRLSAIDPAVWQIDSSGNGSVVTNPTRYETIYTPPSLSFEGTAVITASTTVSVSTSLAMPSPATLTASRTITVATVTWNSSFPIYSSSGVVVHGAVGVTKSADATTCSVSTVTESGVTVMKADYSLQYTTASWAGIYIAEDSADRDMTHFSTTTAILDFWVKASTDLVVSIRSSNITSGEEESKFRLSEYGIALDGTWQHVQLCLDDFKQRDGRLDFSRIRTYISLAVAGNFAYSGTAAGSFYVKDIQWRTPEIISPVFTIALKTVLADSTTDQIRWSGIDATTRWKAADAYMSINVERYDTTPWGVQIYTDNEATDANPKYVHNSSFVAFSSRNPVGLISTTTGYLTLPTCWRIVNSTTSELNIVENVQADQSVKLSTYTAPSGGYYVWVWMKDKNTQTNSALHATQFVNGEDGVALWKSDKGIQHAEGTFGGASPPNYVYIGARFYEAMSNREYKTNQLKVELYTE